MELRLTTLAGWAPVAITTGCPISCPQPDPIDIDATVSQADVDAADDSYMVDVGSVESKCRALCMSLALAQAPDEFVHQTTDCALTSAAGDTGGPDAEYSLVCTAIMTNGTVCM